MLRGKPVSAATFTIAILLFLVGTRWLLAPRYLCCFDSVNFALAMEEFNPALHQPQPPGYPWFVAVTRLIHAWGPSPQHALVIAGLMAAAVAVWLARQVAGEMFGHRAGMLAMALLASNPVFWFGGLTNQVRICLAAASLGVGLLSWRALTRCDSQKWLYAGTAVAGLASGFRPVESYLLIPLLLWTWWRTGHSVRRLLAASALLAAFSLPWIAVTAAAAGGAKTWLTVVSAYAKTQFQPTSVLFGAIPGSALQMLESAVIWNFSGTLVWIWAVPLARPNPFHDGCPKTAFFAVWFLPQFLFSALIHIADPDQALATVAVLSIAGSAVLAGAMERYRIRAAYAVAGAVLAGNALLFFFPPGKTAKASSYSAVAMVGQMVASDIAAVRDVSEGLPAAIVHFGSPMSWRHLSYYFPEDYVFVLPGAPGRPGAGSPLVFHRHKGVMEASERLVPGAGTRRLLYLLPPGARPEPGPEWQRHGSVYYLDPIPASGVKVGRWVIGAPW